MPPLFFNTFSGELQDLSTEQTPEKYIPISDLLLAEEFPFVQGDFDRQKSREWDRERGIEIGRIIVDALLEHDPRAPLTQEMLRRLDILGVFPNFNFVRKHFGTLAQFTDELDAYSTTPSSLFDYLSPKQISDRLLDTFELSNETGKISSAWIDLMYKKGVLPHHNYLLRRGIKIGELNEELGYPDIKKWTLEDYILFGADFVELNGQNSLTVDNLLRIAQKKIGPYPAVVKYKFGSFGKYKYLVMEEYQRQNNRKLQKEAVVNAFYKESGGSIDIDFRTKSMYRALLLLAHRAKVIIRPPLELSPRIVKKNISEIMEQSKLAQAEIEALAVQLDIFDDLWNLRSHYIPPKLV